MKTMVTAKTQAGTLIFYWRFKMTNEVNLSPSNMLRQTAGNLGALFEQIASHIDSLEDEVAKLRTRVEELENQPK